MRNEVHNDLRVAATMMRTAAPKLNALVKAFEDKQSKYSEFGAWDSEPRWFFESLMRKAIQGESFPTVKAEDWELYSTKPGWKSAAKSLTTAAKKIFDTLQNAPYKDVRELANYYGWDD